MGKTETTKSERKRKIVKVIKWLFLSGLILATIAFVILALLIWQWGRDIPDVSELQTLQLDQVTLIRAANGDTISEVYPEHGRRSVIPMSAMGIIPKAIVAAEDEDFYKHGGIDYWGIARAFFVNVKSGRKKQGASTITMQVAKRLFQTPKKSIRRKVRQMILAKRIEEALSKEKILELYLNQIYFGHGRYGVQEASKYYFNKNASELNPGEVAVIAGLGQAPENISPKKKANAERAKNRQVYVLKQMAKNNIITEAEAKNWAKQAIVVADNPTPKLGIAPEWQQIVSDEISKTLGEDKRFKVGGEVVTTVVPKVQSAARTALQNGLRTLDKKNGFGRAIKKIKEKNRSAYSKKLSKANKKKKRGDRIYGMITGLSDKELALTIDIGTKKVRVPLSKRATRLNPKKLPPSARFEIGDVVKVTLGENPPRWESKLDYASLSTGPEAAAVVLDMKTRNVVAMIGGYKIDPKSFNRALMAKRQAGSTFKPFVYAAAIDSEKYTAGSIILDAPEVYDQVSDVWKPQNYKKGEFAGPVRLRHALAKSINTVAIRVTTDVGPGRVVDVAKSLGIKSALPETPSIGLGSGEVKLINLTNAFASLFDGGVFKSPRFVTSLLGQELPDEAPTQAIRPQAAFIVSEMMRSVVTEGTATKARSLNAKAAGKTGTSNRSRDAWFVGAAGQYVMGVWVGYDNDKPIGKGGSGGSAALPIFVETMKKINASKLTLAKPEQITSQVIDKVTGLLAHPSALPVSSIEEFFISGTEPKETAPDPTIETPDSFHGGEYDEDVTTPSAAPVAP